MKHGKALIAYKKTLKLNYQQKQVLIGTLLGDASIANKKGKPVCVKFEQKSTRASYINHLYTIFEPFVGTEPKHRKIENSLNTNKPCYSIHFRTYAHESLLFYDNLFYVIDNNNIRHKRVPKNIHKFLTPQALAYWFMDDGTGIMDHKTGKITSFVLHSQGFCRSDHKILVQALKTNFQLLFAITKDRHYYRLALTSRQKSLFTSIVEPYVHNDFKYKLYNVSITEK